MCRFIDLFAGVGGFHLAFNSEKCVFASEIDINAIETYKLNFPDTILEGDITKIDEKNIPEHDIICAGFPCQPFSVAGYRKGFEDARGALFFDIVRIIKYHKPKAVFLENVKNLENHDNGNTLKTIVDILKDLNYYVLYKVLNSAEYSNIPQNRERIFIVAFNKEKVFSYLDFKFPDPIKLTKTIHDFIESEKQDDIYYYNSTKYYEIFNENIKNKNTVYQWRRHYIRENKSNLCPTLTANMGQGGHNVPIIRDDYGIRKLTPRECFNFQGYPKNFKLPNQSNSKLYKQAGNSIVYPLVKKIADNILKVINNINMSEKTNAEFF
ncbi:DNA cytosine methyltransferase [uncultured Brachyspira sp.]|uniref:DNA cytosine methyltransferase n=1 Tax=uncultured Brachyspira sp. TaxID=221953 RepID=UPI0025E28739|nr:DNA cytosine methyltransferase [uncultured Brachyspira sp.]